MCCVSEQVWQALHKRFGGGPVVTRIQGCELCVAEERRIEERREEEQEMYLKLSRAHDQDYNGQTYYISMVWFRKWQNFIQGDKSELMFCC